MKTVRCPAVRDPAPCSTLVEVKALAIPALLVEINATGFIGAG